MTAYNPLSIQETIQRSVETGKMFSAPIIVVILHNNVEIFRHKFKYNKHMDIINTHSWDTGIVSRCPCGYSFSKTPFIFLNYHNIPKGNSHILFKFYGPNIRKIQRCPLTKNDFAVYDIIT